MLTPATPEELAAALAVAASRKQKIKLGGNFSKDHIYPGKAADITVSTRALNRVLMFEPKDLTISVEAGLPYRELTRLLNEHQMMIPLDPPYANEATIGGVVAANSSGPRRRFYGTARDLVIGMSFATTEGRLIQSGGMVVKNVAGLDMGKLLIGSWGTLGAIVSLNFKLIPRPQETRTFLLKFSSLADAVKRRNNILTSVLQPLSLDLFNPAAAQRIGQENSWMLLIETAGNAAVLNRYQQEFSDGKVVECAIWEKVREFTPAFLADHPQGSVETKRHTLDQLEQVAESADGALVARAGNGVTYIHRATAAAPNPWPAPGNDFEAMQRIKGMLDPGGLLNQGRLYGRI